MNKPIYKDTQALREIDHKKDSPLVVEVETSDVRDKHEDILDSIYTVDPVTRLPTGDIVAFLSDKTSPEVRNFIQTQLMQKVSSEHSLTDVDDETRIALARKHNESRSAYLSRLNDYLDGIKSQLPVAPKSE